MDWLVDLLRNIKMKLKFKEEIAKDTKIIELEKRSSEGDFVLKIDGELIARIWDSGEFYFYGQSENIKYKGRWDE